jgi:fatty-acyl-CoA synthase
VSGLGTKVRVLGRAGVIRPYGPRTLANIGLLVARWGTGPAGGFATRAVRSPHQVGIVDELGELTRGELHRRSNSLARALAERGVKEGGSVAIMCRNQRGFVDASTGVAKIGADILYLNTAFAGPQLVDVLEREAPTMVVHDEEFTGLLAGAHVEKRLLAWADGEGGPDDPETLEQLVAAYDEGDLGIAAAVSLLSRMPLRAGWRTHIAAPLFHTWCFAHLALAVLLGSTVVLRRTFDPATALRTAQEERCQSMVVIPVMLQRMLEDGRLHVAGRDDDMIVSGGENVFPQEVEDCIVAHEHVKAHVARFKVPRDIVFLDELPRNATGKVLKRDLAGQAEESDGSATSASPDEEQE